MIQKALNIFYKNKKRIKNKHFCRTIFIVAAKDAFI